MQTSAMNWLVFGITLAALFFFGIGYACLVRWMNKNKVSGQTAYMVVGGVTVALIASIPTFGLLSIAILFSYFAACGFPMVIEYGLRVHDERRRDEMDAAALARETLSHVEQT